MKQVNISEGFSLTIVSNALTGGGAEISMYALHRAFLNQGLHCNLIALNESDANLLGQNITCLNRRWKSGLFSTISNFLQFRNVIKRFKSDILILNCELPELFGSLTRFKGKIICVEHTTKPWIGKRSLGRIVRTLLHLKNVSGYPSSRIKRRFGLVVQSLGIFQTLLCFQIPTIKSRHQKQCFHM